MSTISIKISDADKARLKKLARERKVSLSALLREGVERVVREAGGAEASCYDLASKYLENENSLGASGLGDLSTNRERMRGFGR